MTLEEVVEILNRQQEAIALLTGSCAQAVIDLDDLRKKARQQTERIAQIEYALAQIQRQLDNRS